MKKLLLSVILIILLACPCMPHAAAFTEYDEEMVARLTESGLLAYAPVSEELPDELREEILRLLGAEPDSVYIQSLGTLSNGMTVINHYEKEAADGKATERYPLASADSNLTAVYFFGSERERVDLYRDGNLLSLAEAGKAEPFGDKLLFELARSVRCYLSWSDAWNLDNLRGGATGDVDGDGSVTVCDATLVQAIAAEVFLPCRRRFQAADIDGDGSVSVCDAAAIQRICAI